MCLINVDLPAPFSPTKPNTHPCGTSNDTSFRAVLAPKRRERRDTLTTVLSIVSPRRLAASPHGKLGLQQPANLFFAQVQRREPVKRRANDALRSLHQFGARNDRVANEGAGTMLEFDHSFMFQFAIRPCD